MHWTPEQTAIIGHPLGAHALVHAAPGAGKTTTLVGRVAALASRVDAARIRVVMFNKAIQEAFVAKLEAAGIAGVKVTTFDALGLEVLRAAERAGLLSRPFEVTPHRTEAWAQMIHRKYRGAIEKPDDIADAVRFWKAHMIPATRAACEHAPRLADAYRELEALRAGGDTLQIDFPDMVYTAVAVLRRRPRLLGAIDHVLVDEFQDVNPGRVELLQRLMHEKTAIMAVGDADQAIYEFSGAHPRFFREFARTFAALETRAYPLSHSFRFDATIAAAARRLIAHNEDRFPIEVVGRGARPGRIARTDDVAGAIQELVTGGHPAREIAVLYRGRVQAVTVLAELAARGVPIESEDLDTLRVGRGPELALAYLRFATSDAPVDFDDAWGVVFAPDRYIRKEAFAAQIRKLGRKGLRVVLGNAKAGKEADQPRGAIESMGELADLLGRMGRCRTAGEALDLLVRETDIPAQLEGRRRSAAELEHAIAAFDAVHVLLRSLAVRPADAARALAEFDPRAGQPADRCVWVSTIHRAKGREWRTVFLPRLHEGLCPAAREDAKYGTVESPEGVLPSDPLEQERRIFYVGLTRAREAVYLEVPETDPSRFVAELEPAAAPKPRPATPKPRPAAPGAKKAAARRVVVTPPNEGARWSEEDDAALAEARAAGATLDELAERLGRSTDAVDARLVIVDARKRKAARRRASAGE